MYTLNSVCFENVNEDRYIVIFKTGSGRNALFTGSSTDFLKEPKITETEYTNVSYIGDGYFIGKNVDDGKMHLFSYDGTTVTDCNANSSNYRSHIDGYFITSNNEIYIHKTGESDSDTLITKISSGNTYKMAKMFEKDGSYYLILDGLKDVYILKDDNFKSLTCTAITNIEVISIVDVVDGEYINVITAESGTKCINLKDNSIDSSWR